MGYVGMHNGTQNYRATRLRYTPKFQDAVFVAEILIANERWNRNRNRSDTRSTYTNTNSRTSPDARSWGVLMEMVMAKHWTRKEDEFLFEYFEALGDFIGTHDLGRPPGAATKRVAKLKACGAWAAMERQAKARHDYFVAIGQRSAEIVDD